jgi:hypothetical protein
VFPSSKRQISAPSSSKRATRGLGLDPFFFSRRNRPDFFRVVNVIGIEHPMQVIDLVLENASWPLFEPHTEFFPMSVLRLDPHFLVAIKLANNTRQGETALDALLCPSRVPGDARIDQGKEFAGMGRGRLIWVI